MNNVEIENKIEALREELRSQTDAYKKAIAESKVFREVKPLYMQAHSTELKILAMKADHIAALNKELEGFDRFAFRE